ncbi:Uu.00g046750.m01.CDS01 [Anthostomella pinea]|uniref:Uu.00g046750.m01.CDS01 n=1 Tax=Anthostomella pinea TaxID=933095 RepID=A0AAI8VC41_9PEZI|nr:Uu.00g046750.m01.CDS01 [Anthostomella pinea]
MATSVDMKLLRATKFPPEFNQKVDMQKVNLQVLKKWIASRISEILGSEDDVVIELCFNLIEGPRYPDIKSMQIQLTGFLDKETAPFCKELWKLCLSGQSSPQGVPKELLEAKKLELIQEKIDADKAAEDIRMRRENQECRDREITEIRDRERRDRGFRGGREDMGVAAAEVVVHPRGEIHTRQIATDTFPKVVAGGGKTLGVAALRHVPHLLIRGDQCPVHDHDHRLIPTTATDGPALALPAHLATVLADIGRHHATETRPSESDRPGGAGATGAEAIAEETALPLSLKVPSSQGQPSAESISFVVLLSSIAQPSWTTETVTDSQPEPISVARGSQAIPWQEPRQRPADVSEDEDRHRDRSPEHQAASTAEETQTPQQQANVLREKLLKEKIKKMRRTSSSELGR